MLRLAAALQVAISHSQGHLGVRLPVPVKSALDFFPGVPIFFLISGFLIYRSFEFNNDINKFYVNRILRLYPALIVCVLVSVAAVAFSGYFHDVALPGKQFVLWLLGQITFVQFYNPEFMRQFGVGVLNGSLWTISVEIQFYLLTPLLFRLVKRSANVDRTFLWVEAGFLIVSIAFGFLSKGDTESFWVKLVSVSFLPWFYMFAVGAHLSQKPSLVRFAQQVRPAAWLLLYLVVAWVASRAGLSFGNQINPALFALLAATVFSIAFNNVGAARRVLRGNDVSYGVYIYHMPVVNVLIYAGARSSMVLLVGAIGATIALAAISWFAIEKPFLRLKPRSLRPIDTAGLPIEA